MCVYRLGGVALKNNEAEGGKDQITKNLPGPKKPLGSSSLGLTIRTEGDPPDGHQWASVT